MFFCASEAEAGKHAQAASERAGFRFFFRPYTSYVTTWGEGLERE